MMMTTINKNTIDPDFQQEKQKLGKTKNTLVERERERERERAGLEYIYRPTDGPNKWIIYLY